MPFLIALALSAVSARSAWASDNPFMQQGIKEYYAGDYINAAGHFGEAESADFNDPKLHYFLGNTFVHLNQRDAAVREYRIAYALEPTGEVGTLSKNALILCGAEKESTTGDKSAKDKDAAAAKTLPDDPRLRDALTRLQQASDSIKQTVSESAQAQANGIAKMSDIQAELLKKHTQDVIDDVKHVHRVGGAMAEEARAEGVAKQQSVQRYYDNSKSEALNSGRRRASAIDESANNLQQLMNEPSKPGHVKLTPTGTNLYVRNYEFTQEQEQPQPKALQAKQQTLQSK
jgi:tetratricopeptide (TPR) repeat protein